MEPPPGPKKYPGSTISEQGITSLFCFHLPIIFSRKRRLFKQPTNPSVTSLNQYKSRNSINELLAYQFYECIMLKCDKCYLQIVSYHSDFKGFRQKVSKEECWLYLNRLCLACSLKLSFQITINLECTIPGMRSEIYLMLIRRNVTERLLIEIRSPTYPKR